MFVVDHKTISKILSDYGICAIINNVIELQRYDFENKEVRLIVKVELSDKTSVVIRFKNEHDVSLKLVESQSSFAEVLRNNGIHTPVQYTSNKHYANMYCIEEYDVIVTVEAFVENEIHIVDETIANKTGQLLAKTHTIAERNNLHIKNDVLFNPFKRNDLFDFESFCKIKSDLNENDRFLILKIKEKYLEYMQLLSPLRNEIEYAVQGDISDCNLYQTIDGEIGIFDFNRSGDNLLYCDAVMQAVFESRLMNYPEGYDTSYEKKILDAFWKGYHSIRSFTKEEQELYPYLYTIIDAFWAADIRWDENSLLNAYERHDLNKVHQHLESIWKKLIAVSQNKLEY